MASPPHMRAPQLTPIPEHAPRLVATAATFYPSSTAKLDMTAAIPTPAPGLHISFYDLPDAVPAIFSTCMQSRPKRKLVAPYPQTMVRSDLGLDVQRKVKALWERNPVEARKIIGIQEWFDLYRYFDAVDLWVEGPIFCYSVIFRLAEMNRELNDEQPSIIREFAREWVDANSKRLVNVAEHIDVITLLTPEECQSQDFQLLTEIEIKTLKFELNKARSILLEEHRRLAMMNAPTHPTQSVYPQYPHPSQGPLGLRPDHSVPQSYQHFMDGQRNLHGGVDNASRDHRPRAWSNATQQGRGSSRFNNMGQQPKATPRSTEPIYVLTEQRQRGASAADMTSRRYSIPTRPRTFSNTSRTSFYNNARDYQARRTVSDEVSSRPFNPGKVTSVDKPYYQHSRGPSGSSTAVAYPYGPGPGTQTPMSQPEEDLGIEGYESRVHTNQSATIFYTGPKRKLDEQPARTVFLSGAPEEMFLDHTLRDMMECCGSVETISHLRNRGGTAFVLFHHESAVKTAIRMWNGYEIVPGGKLAVRPPEKRERGYSMSNISKKTGYSQFRASPGRYVGHGHTRNFSANMRSEPSFRAAVPEALENRHVQAHFTPLQDIQNISPKNKNALHKALDRPFFDPSTAPSTPKKENSPLATPSKSRGQTPKAKKTFNHPKRNSQQNSRQPTPLGSPMKPIVERTFGFPNGTLEKEQLRQNVLRKNNSDNDFAEHPTSTPVPVSEHVPAPQPLTQQQPNKCVAKVVQKPESSTKTGSDIEPGPASIGRLAEAAPKKSKSKSKKKGNGGHLKTAGNASFLTDSSSETIISPVSNENDSISGNPSTNTSFSTTSSRQQSFTNPKSRKSRVQSEDAEIHATGQADTRKPRDNVGASIRASKDSRNEASENVDKKKVEATTDEGLMIASKAKNKTQKPSKRTTTFGESIRQPSQSSHSKQESTSSLTSNHSQRKADVMAAEKEIRSSMPSELPSVVANADVEADHTPMPSTIPSTSGTEVKKVNNQAVSVAVPSPVINSNQKIATHRPAPITVPSPVASISKSQASASSSSPAQDLQTSKSLPEMLKSPKRLDEQEWPSLNPVKSPVAAIADGKAPTPLRAPLMGLLGKTTNDKSPELQKATKSTFPPVAVPRAFQTRSPS
ncbi:uncharacterized protein LY89DRAFT_176977 [Mollisia scopiformis]|uniref:RRM domain-containing protein n=1 Tax=Mollisia scopiformis TaxID=149040 RepID=A0A194XT64_MOLSC|nr:uncharacterized protein LY89DRAFT_176977 [Mollisia scopiformis]KUJ23239.1 hypothetical protein LY89DRAFT_176977 [Mollisia scopiformis]